MKTLDNIKNKTESVLNIELKHDSRLQKDVQSRVIFTKAAYQLGFSKCHIAKYLGLKSKSSVMEYFKRYKPIDRKLEEENIQLILDSFV